MKWAPNKKLHFEVAVIKAIQTLGQVTLDEVIENLATLRDGSAPPTPSVVRQSSTPGKIAAPKKEPQESPGPAKTSVAPTKEETAPLASVTEPGAIWAKVSQLASTRRALVRSWLEAAQLLESKPGEISLGFAREQKMAMESLDRPNSRSFLEALLKEVAGTDWALKMKVVDDLAPVEKPAREQPGKSRPNESAQTFRDDPLIKEALEIFKGEIKSVTT